MAVKLRRGAVAHVKRVAKSRGKTLTTPKAIAVARRRTARDAATAFGGGYTGFDYAGDNERMQSTKRTVQKSGKKIKRTVGRAFSFKGKGGSRAQQGSGDSTTKPSDSRFTPGQRERQKGGELAASRRAAKLKGSGSPSRDFKGGPMGARNTRKIMKEERYLRHNPDGTARIDVERKPIQERRQAPERPKERSAESREIERMARETGRFGRVRIKGVKVNTKKIKSTGTHYYPGVSAKPKKATRTSRIVGPTGRGMY